MCSNCRQKADKIGKSVLKDFFSFKVLQVSKIVVPLQAKSRKQVLVPWMSGLVSGLQNRVRRFESARNLERQVYVTLAFFLLHEGHNGIETEGDDKRRKF